MAVEMSMEAEALTLVIYEHWALALLLALPISTGIIYILTQRYQRYLRSIPGPFLASFTDLWRFVKVREGRFELILQALHDQYGDLVRVGPNCISVADPREIRQIYGISRLFQKVCVGAVPYHSRLKLTLSLPLSLY